MTEIEKLKKENEELLDKLCDFEYNLGRYRSSMEHAVEVLTKITEKYDKFHDIKVYEAIEILNQGMGEKNGNT